ncbi:MAG: N-methylhydantoinase [Thermomicrobiales bacterium]|jgi:N-methylhydantoinase B|nr:N-methylhydantoinase [Thermomicrobiales bacterium]
MKDQVFIEILRNRFQAIANEMASTILRTGYTVFVKETADYGAGLVSRSGELFAAPVNLGVSVMIGMPVEAVIRQIEWEDGDVVIVNDPYSSEGLITHLPDIYLIRPIFDAGELVCFAMNFVHSSDIGGRVPGSISPSSTDIFQEGLRIPPYKLVRKGELDEAFLRLFLSNCRIPDQNWGDLRALLSALHTADTRIRELITRYGREPVLTGIDGVLDYGEMRARALISALPDGDYEFIDYLEADMTPVGLIRLKLTLRIKGDELTFDFTGTDPQVQAAMNLPSHSHRGHWMIVIGVINYFRTVDPHVPYNSGLVRPLNVIAPRGSVVNPEPPAACGVRAAAQFRILDMTMGALGRVAPEIIPAAGAGQISIALVATPDIADGEMKVSVLQPLCGGSGGRPVKDGIEAGDFCTFLRNIPNETLEHDLPIVINRYGLRPDSAGPGEHRGGSGVEFSFQLTGPTAAVTARGMERYVFPPWGRRGGSTGTTGLTMLRRTGEAAESIGKIDLLNLRQGDELTLLTQGGGGFGDPFVRDPQRVLADIVRGLVTVEAAERDYGVVILDGAVDEAATVARRQERVETPTGEYTLGPAREAYDRAWPGESQESMNALIKQFPNVLRPFARAELLAELRPLATKGSVTLTDVEAAFARLSERWRGPHAATTTVLAAD